MQVKTDEVVEAGTVLGQIGLSGRTQFPHVHLSVRKDGKVVDPFDPDGSVTCGEPDEDTLFGANHCRTARVQFYMPRLPMMSQHLKM